MAKRLNKRLIARAEAASDRLARATEVLEGLAWEIDSALSAIRKDAAGYRTRNAANRDGGESYVDGELEAALAKFDKLAAALVYFEVGAGAIVRADFAEIEGRVLAHFASAADHAQA